MLPLDVAARLRAEEAQEVLLATMVPHSSTCANTGSLVVCIDFGSAAASSVEAHGTEVMSSKKLDYQGRAFSDSDLQELVLQPVPARSAQELLRLQKQAQVCCTEGLEMNDLVVVVAKERRHFGRVCFVQYAERTSISVEVLPVQDIQLGASDLSVEFRFGGIIPDPQALKRSDVLKLPWPSLRKPPKPMTEQHLIEQEWDSLSKKRFSPGRLHSIWHDLDGQTRRRYRQLSTRAEEVYQQMLLSRFRVFSVLKELIDLAPGPALNGYFLYMQMHGSSEP
eukprot:g9835.t1